MSSSATEIKETTALSVECSDDTLIVNLFDGRSISVPFAWYPRLKYGSAPERSHWKLIANGQSIHWPELDEDIRVGDLLAGIRSGESSESLQRWIKSRS